MKTKGFIASALIISALCTAPAVFPGSQASPMMITASADKLYFSKGTTAKCRATGHIPG